MSAPIFDHIVILVPHATLSTLANSLKDTLNVVTGGTHADGLTANDLIFFGDGSYIEIIAFVPDADPERRAAHRWGKRKENTIIDWAYTLPEGQDFSPVQERVIQAAGGVYVYDDPVPGGRTRPDGEVLKWAVAAARDTREGEGSRVDVGRLPFWCLDRTPRALRVPYVDNPQAAHPSGAVGVARVKVKVPFGGKEADELARVYDGVHGAAKTGDRSWRFKAHSGLDAGDGKQSVELVEGGDGPAVELVLLGGEGSPKEVEFLPGLHVRFEG